MCREMSRGLIAAETLSSEQLQEAGGVLLGIAVVYKTHHGLEQTPAEIVEILLNKYKNIE